MNTIKNWIDSFQQTEGGGDGEGLPDPTPLPSIPLEPTFTSVHANILVPKCVGCHRVGGSQPEQNFENYMNTILTGGIEPGDAESSDLFKVCEDNEMPRQPIPPLTNEELTVLGQWIDQGALNN